VHKFLKETNAQIIKEIFYIFFIIGRGYLNFMFKNNWEAFLKLVDFKKCQEQLLKVLENNYNMLHINVFQNLNKSKMNNKCNLWEMNMWILQTQMQHGRGKPMNNIKMQQNRLSRKT